MKPFIIVILYPAVGAACLAAGRTDYPLTPVPFTAVQVQDDFWSPRMETNRMTTLQTDFKKCEETK